MSNAKIVVGLALAMAGVAIAPSHAKTTLEVGTCVTGLPNFSTIGSAITAAPKGATIDICPGTYPEQITLSKNLTLTAVDTSGTTSGSSSLVHVTVPASGFAVNASDPDNGNQPVAAQLVVASDVTAKVIGLGFDASGSTFTDCSTNLVGVFVQGATVTLQNNAVLNDTLGPSLSGCQDGEGIVVENGGANAKATISGNHIAGFDKNGISVQDTGTTATVSGNTIQGGGPTAVAAQNGVVVISGAAATVSGNLVADIVYGGGTDYAASSILVYDAKNAIVTGNVINESQYGVVVYSDGGGSADNPTITKNRLGHMTLVDSIEVCGAANATVNTNTIFGSQLSAIHIDGTCTGSSAGSIAGNIINYACTGILDGAGSTVGKNTFYNTPAEVLNTDSCPGSQASVRRARRVLPRP